MHGLDGVIPKLRHVGLHVNRWFYYVELVPSEPARSQRGCGGILILPEKRCNPEVYLGGWNVTSLDNDVVTNHHHAETQVLSWLARQDEKWRARVESVQFAVERSPCAFCATNLVEALEGRQVGHRRTDPLIRPQEATLSWKRLYVNDRQGLTTTLEHLVLQP